MRKQANKTILKGFYSKPHKELYKDFYLRNKSPIFIDALLEINKTFPRVRVCCQKT
jgi:hypothetical protein